MGHDCCQQGCYPVDKKWHGGGFSVKEKDIAKKTAAGSPEELERRLGSDVYSGGTFTIKDIVDFRAYVDAFGPGPAEKLLRELTPADEPYMRGAPSGSDKIWEKPRKRSISISMGGQGKDMEAYVGAVDTLSTHYKFDPVVKTVDWQRATPNSQVHNEMLQRRQQAEQQIGRIMSNLVDFYQQKQLLEHDLRKLSARLEHVKKGEDAASKGYEGFEDELKADFVDLVDQHTGRSSILQMQANNIFPSITADFYSMSGLDDLRDGHLKHLPENEKAVLRKKWKLYEQWKEQFQTAVRSKHGDIKKRLNSIEKSIKDTEEWLKPYVHDITQVTGNFDDQLDMSIDLSGYLPEGYSNIIRRMKVIGAKDVAAYGMKEGAFRDVIVMEPIKGSMPSFENPAATGQGLTLFKMVFYEYLVCEHVYEAVFEEQINRKKDEVNLYIKQYIGEEAVSPGVDELNNARDKVRSEFDVSSTIDERLENAETMQQIEDIRRELQWKQSKPSFTDRRMSWLKAMIGTTDGYYHPDPKQLRYGLVGPGFPRGFLLDYKYGNGMFVTK